MVWRYLNVTLKDMDSGKEIIINQSKIICFNM
nr:GAPES1 domain-containing protein [Salmonella enterica]